MMKYTPQKIEKKWQKYWEKEGIFKDYSRKEKFYALDMFPYPSGAGLHVGHPKGYVATDIVSRFEYLRGKSVLHPMGWDAFGLPAENYAIKNKIHPRKAVQENIKRFKEQLQKIGFTYDWDREINTTDPEYYRWTQWIFLKMFEKGLAYESEEPVNWCSSCKTVLANEDLEQGKCERCGGEITQRPLRQWVLKMTDYAERLLGDLDTENIQWEKSIIEQQKNWIGRSEGVTVQFRLKNEEAKKENTCVGVGCLLRTKNGTFIFQERDNNTVRDPEKIALFGGGKNSDESERDCVIREMKEELDISVKNELISFIGDFPSKNTSGEIIKVFLVDNVSLEEISLKEGKNYYVASLEEALQNAKITDFTKEVLLASQENTLEVFTTRVDTIFGCTYVVIAPEHPLLKDEKVNIKNSKKVEEYIEKAKKKTAMERGDLNKEKTGVQLEGVEVVNPFTGESVPVFVADYVLGSYGTGAVMAVPAHDERGWDFAKKYNLPLRKAKKQGKIKKILIFVRFLTGSLRMINKKYYFNFLQSIIAGYFLVGE